MTGRSQFAVRVRWLLCAAILVLPVSAYTQSASSQSTSKEPPPKELSSTRAQPAQIKPDLELGEYLSAECTTCHRRDRVNQGIPSIFGRPKVLFLQAMRQYQKGIRPNQEMQNIARSLSEEDLVSLGAYFELKSPQ